MAERTYEPGPARCNALVSCNAGTADCAGRSRTYGPVIPKRRGDQPKRRGDQPKRSRNKIDPEFPELEDNGAVEKDIGIIEKIDNIIFEMEHKTDCKKRVSTAKEGPHHERHKAVPERKNRMTANKLASIIILNLNGEEILSEFSALINPLVG